MSGMSNFLVEETSLTNSTKVILDISSHRRKVIFKSKSLKLHDEDINVSHIFSHNFFYSRYGNHLCCFLRS